MNTDPTQLLSASPSLRPLRVSPYWFVIPLIVVFRFLSDLIEDGPTHMWVVGAFGPFLIAVLAWIWWLTGSRASRKEKLWVFCGLIGILGGVLLLGHKSLRGPVFTVWVVPVAVAAFTLGVLVWRKSLYTSRTSRSLVISALAAAAFLLVKSEGVWGNFSFGFSPRWKAAAGLGEVNQQNASPQQALAPGSLTASEWPSFRGPRQDGVQRGARFADWRTHPPKELWRIPVGAAWSSFVAAGDYLFTQEQRGDRETTVCYAAASGQQVWAQGSETRFYDGLGGLGPRATPSYHDGHLYTMGGEGWVTKLNALNGETVWRVDIRTVAQCSAPMWGFASSPLVDGDNVVVYAGGNQEKPQIIALKRQDGSTAWTAPAGKESYGSVQKLTLLGKPFLALATADGVQLWEPGVGKEALAYSWPHGGYRALFLSAVGADKILIPTGLGSGTRLIELKETEGKLTASELWTCDRMKPDFSDGVIYQNCFYGIDNKNFSCIRLDTGEQAWKGGRYDKGQALLLEESGFIIVIAERGDLVLLRATSEKLDELVRLPCLKDKTWNHPVVVGNRLFVRNAVEAVCFELAVAGQ